jgi:hypothetical protein
MPALTLTLSHPVASDRRERGAMRRDITQRTQRTCSHGSGYPVFRVANQTRICFRVAGLILDAFWVRRGSVSPPPGSILAGSWPPAELKHMAFSRRICRLRRAKKFPSPVRGRKLEVAGLHRCSFIAQCSRLQAPLPVVQQPLLLGDGAMPPRLPLQRLCPQRFAMTLPMCNTIDNTRRRCISNLPTTLVGTRPTETGSNSLPCKPDVQ